MRPRSITLPAALLLALSCLLPAAARADSVLYTFTGTGPATGTQFTYLSTSGFLTFGTQTNLPTTTGDLYFDTHNYGPVTNFVFLNSTVAHLAAYGLGFDFYMLDYSLDQCGLQTPISQFGDDNSFTLDIEPIPATTAVTPEPSSLMLLGTGVVGVAGALRRRFAHAV